MVQSIRSKASRLTALSLLLVFSLVMYQCGEKSSDDPAPSSASVVGTWKITGLTISPAQNGVSDYFALLVGLAPCFAEIRITLNSNGTASTSIPSGCAFDADDLTDQTGIDKDTKWAVSGNKIIFTDKSGGKEEYTLNVSGSTMKWSTTEKDPTDGKTYTTTLSFTKV
ncbi:MAG: lipocalin family protein [Cytophagaceae bacterium]|nr:lipocalin family protein [Cytophagaceae bacterium]